MLTNLLDTIAGRRHEEAPPPPEKLSATVALVKKSVLGLNDFMPSLLDIQDELVGDRVFFHLVSATAGEPNKLYRGRISPSAFLEHWRTPLMTSVIDGVAQFNLQFEWDEDHGVLGIVI